MHHGIAAERADGPKRNFTAETRSSASSKSIFIKPFFTRRPLRLCGERSENFCMPRKNRLRELRITMLQNLRGSRKLRCNFEIECYMQSEFLTTKHTKATKNGKRIIIKMRSALI
jgi:hypothetical protein